MAILEGEIMVVTSLRGPKRGQNLKKCPVFVVKKGPQETATKSWLCLLYFRFLLSQLLSLFLLVSPYFPVVS